MERTNPINDEVAVTNVADITNSLLNEEIDFNKVPDTFIITPISLKESKKYLILKRILDVIASVLGLIVLSPFLIILCLIIKFEDSNASVFFSQERVGLNGKKFKMFKFRSMVSDAEDLLGELLNQNETTGAMFKMANDPRVTKVGRVIRKTSLDELPQLWNVLKGDMSLVGPRPPLPREVLEYTTYDLQRLLVAPGCTGLWQVSGRSTLGFKEMVDLDIFYIKNRCLMIDIKIIIKTLIMLFKSKGAY